MIAYFFPPVGGIGSAGSQRVLKFAKYLPAYRWTPVILTVREEYYEAHFHVDPSLFHKIPPGLTIVRTRVIRLLTKLLECKQKVKKVLCLRRKDSPIRMRMRREKVNDAVGDIPFDKGWYQRLKDAVTDLFEIPDEEMGWFLPGLLAGLGTIKRDHVDVIYATGRPWTALLIGTALKLITGKPLAVDFRDPWMTNPFRLKYSLLRDRLETCFERKVIEHADLVIANTVELQGEFIKRFPEQPRDKFVSILNGFDPDDYQIEVSFQDDDAMGYFTITHTGFLYGKRDPRMFLEAVKVLIERQEIDSKKLRIYLVGSIELPYDLQEYLNSSKLSDIVTLKDHVPFEESLDYMRRSDLLLLLQPGTKSQIPSKLFEYVGVKKPILAISPGDGATSSLISKECLGAVAEPDDVLQIAGAIQKIYQQWQAKMPLATVHEGAYKKFNVKNMTAVLASRLPQLSLQ